MIKSWGMLGKARCRIIDMELKSNQAELILTIDDNSKITVDIESTTLKGLPSAIFR